MDFALICNEWNILLISILTNDLCIITIILMFDRKREVMDISAIDETIISQEEITLPSASSNGNNNL